MESSTSSFTAQPSVPTSMDECPPSALGPDPQNPHTAFLHLCIGLSLALLIMLPASVLLCLLLIRAKRIHRNTRLLLTTILLAIWLDLVCRAGKVLLFQIALNHNVLPFPAHLLHHELLLCLQQITSSPSQSDLPLQIGQLLRWTVLAPSLLSSSLINSLPLALVAEKCFATLFFKHYENGKRFLWIGIGIVAIQLLIALLLLANTLQSADSLALPQLLLVESVDQYLHGQPVGPLFRHLLALVLFVLLLGVNNKLSRQLSVQFSTSSSCSFSRMSSASPRLVTCRYQLRDNRRSLRFCTLLSLAMCVQPVLRLLLQLLRRHGTETAQSSTPQLRGGLLHAMLQPNAMSDLQELVPLMLALLCTLFGHETLRQTLLCQLGTHCKEIARRNAKMRRRSITVAVTSASSACNVSSEKRNSRTLSRVADMQELNETLKNAHFDALQAYWARNGPEKRKKCCSNMVARSEPCSTAEMVVHLQ